MMKDEISRQLKLIDKLIDKSCRQHGIQIERSDVLEDSELSTVVWGRHVDLLVSNYSHTGFEPRDFVASLDLELIDWQFAHKIKTCDLIMLWCSNPCSESGFESCVED